MDLFDGFDLLPALLAISPTSEYYQHNATMAPFCILSARRDRRPPVHRPKLTERSVSGATVVSSTSREDIVDESDDATLLDGSSNRDRDSPDDNHHSPRRWWRWSSHFLPVFTLTKHNHHNNAKLSDDSPSGVSSLHIGRRRQSAGVNLESTGQKSSLPDLKFDLGVRRRIFGFDGEHWGPHCLFRASWQSFYGEGERKGRRAIAKVK
ncbi:hypothetical protein V8F33_011647 [Rhypophila sp. PSN 637]